MTHHEAEAVSPPRPRATKVPEITALFWAIKILSTGMGETFSDFLVNTVPPVAAVGGGAVLLIVCLWRQLRAPAYRVWTYWTAVVAVSIVGTMAADIVDFVVGIPLPASTLTFAALLAATLLLWYRSEGTLSIHSITTRRRESFYWATVMITFALGTVAGDLTAATLRLGYLPSAILFAVAFIAPGLAHRWLGLGAVAAFWSAYIVTRPLGASVTDWLASSRADGLGLGTGWVSLAVSVPMIAGIAVLARRAREDDLAPYAVNSR
ncbi:COG4705 family protein [Nocardia sp. NPDC003482]